MLNVAEIRKQFPILEQKIHGKPLIYFDNAATALKPKSVADRIYQHYLYETSNVHRGLHFLSDQATENFEHVRKQIQKFINAKEDSEIVFTKGTTDGINLVAHGFGKVFCDEGDEILISEIEHHSNIVPWQIMAEERACKVKSFEVSSDGQVNLEDFKKKLSPKTKIVALTYVSNSLGTVFPVQELTQLAHQNNSVVVLDAAQAVAHQKVDVQKIDCDFMVFSSHKLYGPTGVGVLYGKFNLLEKIPPYQGGGGMIDEVHIEKTTYLKPPFRFEAGTPHIAGVIGLGAAIDFLNQFDIKEVHAHESKLTHMMQNVLLEIPGVQVYGQAKEKDPIVSFYVEGTHPTDIGSMLDQDAIAVRCGHHCTQPLMRKLGIPGTVRASFAIYNTEDEVKTFATSLKKVIRILKG